MRGVLLPWNPTFHSLSSPSLPSLFFTPHRPKKPFNLSIHASSSSSSSPSSPTTETTSQELTARERRRLRNERRESNAYNWKEEVEERFIKKKKKEKKPSWTEQLNLDNLAKLGPQWWVVRVSRVKVQYTSELLARSLAKNFPDMEFKVVGFFIFWCLSLREIFVFCFFFFWGPKLCIEIRLHFVLVLLLDKNGLVLGSFL